MARASIKLTKEIAMNQKVFAGIMFLFSMGCDGAAQSSLKSEGALGPRLAASDGQLQQQHQLIDCRFGDGSKAASAVIEPAIRTVVAKIWYASDYAGLYKSFAAYPSIGSNDEFVDSIVVKKS